MESTQDTRDTRTIEELTESIRLNPNDAEAYYLRGLSYAMDDVNQSIDDFDKAMAIIDSGKATKLSPDFSLMYILSGVVYQKQGNYDRAITEFDKAIRLDPNAAGNYTSRGEAYIHKKDYDKAMLDLNHAIQLDPNYADAYSLRGLTYSRRGEFDRALADWKRTLEINPDDDIAKQGIEMLAKYDE